MPSVETWMVVPGYEGFYEASNLGRIRSVERTSANGRKRPSIVLSAFTNPNGHQQVHLSRENVKRTHWVHRLVLLAFVGPPPANSEALHRNGDPADNRLENLAWGTRSENALDQVRHGVHFYASRTHCPAGHPYNASNTYRAPGAPHRKCRECMRLQARRTNERRRAARKEARSGHQRHPSPEL